MKCTALIPAFMLLGCTTEQLPLRHGDLLFQVTVSDDFSRAIQQATATGTGAAFTHVGILSIAEGDTTVIEAAGEQVREVPFRRFLAASATVEGRPAVQAARVRDGGVKRDEAVRRARSYLGRPYDALFAPGDEAIYCSELVWLSYLDDTGAPLFATRPMSFRDKATGAVSPLWEAHFAHLAAPIPEGVPGTNPGDMSRDEQIDIVYSFL